MAPASIAAAFGVERVSSRIKRANALDLPPDVAQGLSPTRGAQGLADPLGDGHPLGPGDAADLAQLRFIQEHLEPLTRPLESLTHPKDTI
jgi:hypothetical protein